ncbi:MAG TPA: SGNH/GDSL hydrolase family protein [Spirochaetia bacterium]|nr:SGNH/GDSL hydrolase family protein [Spirochaetia bacterium]
MKQIVCFGDSNTWGYNPESQSRYPKAERWPGVMAAALGNGYEVIEEGLNGRTTVWQDPIEEHKCGKDHLIPIMRSHKPFDLLIIMLGTNDLKHRFSLTPFDIAEGAGRLVRIARTIEDSVEGPAPRVLLLAPPPVSQLTSFAEMFKGAEEKSRKLGEEFARVARELACPMLDLAKVAASSPVDGIHFDRENQQKIGTALAEKVKQILK